MRGCMLRSASTSLSVLAVLRVFSTAPRGSLQHSLTVWKHKQAAAFFLRRFSGICQNSCDWKTNDASRCGSDDIKDKQWMDFTLMAKYNTHAVVFLPPPPPVRFLPSFRLLARRFGSLLDCFPCSSFALVIFERLFCFFGCSGRLSVNITKPPSGQCETFYYLFTSLVIATVLQFWRQICRLLKGLLHLHHCLPLRPPSSAACANLTSRQGWITS